MKRGTVLKVSGITIFCLITAILFAACSNVTDSTSTAPSEAGPGLVRTQGPGALAEVAVSLAVILLVVAAVGYITWRLAPPDEAWISAHAPAQPRGLVAFVRRHPLLSYFVLAYAMTWLFWLPLALSQSGVGLLPIQLPMTLMMGAMLFGPIGAAYVATAITSGRAGVRQLLRRIVLWRVGFQWWAFALAGLPLLLWLGAVLAFPDALSALSPAALPAILPMFAGAFLSQLLQSGLFEEPGWRGFALPRLQEAHGALMGSVILGLLWGGWHLPLFLIPGLYIDGSGLFDVGVPFAMSLVMAAAVSIVFTWVFNHTKGSVLMAIVLHASMNSWGAALQSAVMAAFPNANVGDMQFQIMARLIGFGLFALAIVVLSRAQLGYQRYRASRGESVAVM
jgi:CAAX protease family protein